MEFQLEYGRSACLEQTGNWRLEVYANAAASIGGGEVDVMLEKVGSHMLGSGKTRSLCMPQSQTTQRSEVDNIKTDAATLLYLLAKEIYFNQSPAS